MVVEKSRGVGGRAATRRIDGQPVDHGLSFYHGSSPDFLQSLLAVEDATPLVGWPSSIAGDGPPCLPRAFEPGERRIAFAEGLTAFPKWMARGLDVRRQQRVTSIALDRDGSRVVVSLESGDSLASSDVVMALPIEQSLELLRGLEEPNGGKRIASLTALVSGLKSVPCLTVMATYSLDRREPEWDMCYPDGGDVLTLVSHDSSKRRKKDFHALVFQCSAAFSRRHLEDSPSDWSAAVLAEATRVLGDWALEPAAVHTHRWRFARTPASTTLAEPLVWEWDGGARIAFAGEIFAAGGGVEAAYLSGRAVAERLLGSR